MRALLKLSAVLAWCWLGGLTLSAQELAEVFGRLPEFEDMSLSPSGEQVAVTQNTDDGTQLLVIELSTMTPRAKIPVKSVKVRQTRWIDEDRLVLNASSTTNYNRWIRGKYEYSSAFGIDLKRKSAKQLLVGTKDVFENQSGLGRLIAADQTGDYVYMPAVRRSFGRYEYNLFKVSLSHGKGVVEAFGDANTSDFLISPAGELIARESYNNDTNVYELAVPGALDGWDEVIREQGSLPPYSLEGIMPDGKSLIVHASRGSETGGGYYTVAADDRELRPLEIEAAGRPVESIITDINRRALGIAFGGVRPSYDFFDPDLDAAYSDFVQHLRGEAAYLLSWSADKQKLLFLVESGQGGVGTYFLIDRSSGQIQRLGARYAGIENDRVGRVHTIEYEAEDGLAIEGIVTWPPKIGSTDQSGLPLILLPHGGPSSYDRIGFDYMAQFFANKGYIVLQPNFRGSTGYGGRFQRAGYGEWGRKMQSDLTDGLDAMVARGWADPDRVCIVGWSYGGYAALAGGAFQADRYKCVVAGAGVADLPLMLIDSADRYGSNSWVLDYWRRSIDNIESGAGELKAVSPAYFADNFRAPVLLLHGNDDTVVEIEQSHRMESALKAAGKTVEFGRLKDEDHFLSRRETRIEALEAMGQFVDRYLKAD